MSSTDEDQRKHHMGLVSPSVICFLISKINYESLSLVLHSSQFLEIFFLKFIKIIAILYQIFIPMSKFVQTIMNRKY